MRGVKSTQQRWGCNILCAIFSDEAELFHFPFERTSRKLSTKTKLSLGKNWARVIFSWIKRVYDYCFAGRKLGLNEKLVGILNFGRLIIFLCPFLESNTSLYLIGFWLDAKSVNHLMRWLIPIGQMSDGLGHHGGCKLTLYAVDHILGCGPWGSSQIENAGAECIFCVSCPFVRTGGLLLVFLMIDHPHVKHSSCEENYAFRSKMLTRSTTFGQRRYHLSSPLNWWPHWNTVTEWGAHHSQHSSPSPKSEAESTCFYNNKKTQFHLRKMWFDVEEGDQLRQSDLEVPLGLGCLVLLGLEAVHSCLRYVKHWVPTGQIIAQMAGALLAASKRLGQTCPHPMPYCTVRIVLLWDVRVVICALRCRQNFTTIVVSV